jgi:glycerophosphoryl diester phosphodiesterase
VAFLDSPTPLAFAHRGFSPGGDENSMAAFERAVALGYRYLETDVRVTRDGVALAFHDASLDRVTDRTGVVAELRWEQVRAARIGGTEPIPPLADVLTSWPDVRVIIDVKSGRGVGPTVDVIRRTGSQDRVCVASFSGARIDRVRRALGPSLCTSLKPREALALRAASIWQLPRVRSLGQCVQVPARLGRVRLIDRRYLVAAHRLGLQVHAWTVNDRAEMTRLLDLGVDGLITDRADVLRELLVERGQWLPATGTG